MLGHLHLVLGLFGQDASLMCVDVPVPTAGRIASIALIAADVCVLARGIVLCWGCGTCLSGPALLPSQAWPPCLLGNSGIQQGTHRVWSDTAQATLLCPLKLRYMHTHLCLGALLYQPSFLLCTPTVTDAPDCGVENGVPACVPVGADTLRTDGITSRVPES